MLLLIFNIVLSIVEAILVFGIVKQKWLAKKYYCILIFFQCTILHAFVDPDSMVDLPGYVMTYDLFGENPLKYSIITGYVGIKMELGWILLCKILYFISHNYRTLLIFSSVVMVGGYCYTIFRYSPMAWLSVFIYLCSVFDQSLFVLRQHMAMAICLLSMPYIINHQIKNFLLLLLIAVSIHSTAIIFGFIFLLYNYKFNKSFWIKIFICSIIFKLLSDVVINWIFANTWYGSYEDKDGSNYTGFFISMCSLILYLFSVKGNTRNISGMEKCFLSLSIIAVILSFIGVGFSPTNRLAKYFTISSIFLIPISISKFNNITFKYILIILILLSYSILFISPSNIIYIENYSLSF